LCQRIVFGQERPVDRSVFVCWLGVHRFALLALAFLPSLLFGHVFFVHADNRASGS
jgi:hypothetical protein